MKVLIEIPVEWCRDKDIRAGFLSLEAAREIALSDIPDEDVVTVKARFKDLDRVGSTEVPAAAIRAKYKEELLLRG